MLKRHILPTLMALALSQAVQAQSTLPSGGAYGAYAGGGMNTPSSSESLLFTQLQQMQSEMALLRGMLEEQQEQIRRMQREAQDRYQDLDQRIVGLQSSASSTAPAAAPQMDASAAQPQVAEAPADPEKERIYYDAAFDLVKNRDFDRAQQAFGAFLRKYPSSQYAGNAQYWLGEVSLAKGDLKGAAQAFVTVGQLYPKHSKVPDALYKLADVEQRMGNTEKAQGILRQLLSQYPDSSAAQLAKRQVKP